MTWDERNFSSIANCVSAARENARSIREVISSELWETVNELHLWFASPLARAEYQHERYGFYRKVRQACQLAAGYRRSTMLHDEPVNFMWLGVLLERVSQTARVVDVHHHALSLIEKTDPVVETALWLSLLRACSGFEPFIKVHQGKVTGDAVAAFLIFEGRFPKSVVYGVRGALSRFAEIRPPAERDLPGQETYERLRALDAWLAGGARPTSDFHGGPDRGVDETASIFTRSRETLALSLPPCGVQPDAEILGMCSRASLPRRSTSTAQARRPAPDAGARRTRGGLAASVRARAPQAACAARSFGLGPARRRSSSSIAWRCGANEANTRPSRELAVATGSSRTPDERLEPARDRPSARGHDRHRGSSASLDRFSRTAGRVRRLEPERAARLVRGPDGQGSMTMFSDGVTSYADKDATAACSRGSWCRRTRA
jgi:hypothetical protein